MALDIKIRFNTDFMGGDFIFEDNDFETDEGLGSAVMISWFTDQRASEDDVIPNAVSGFIDKKGWWGDVALPTVQGDQIGSKLWLLDRSKTIESNINLAIGYAETALEWLLDDGIAKDIAVTGERLKFNNDYILALKAEITKIDGNKLNITFDPEWFTTLSEDYT